MERIRIMWSKIGQQGDQGPVAEPQLYKLDIGESLSGLTTPKKYKSMNADQY